MDEDETLEETSTFQVDKDKYHKIGGKALKLGKKVNRGWYYVKFETVCFDDFVNNETRGAGAGSVLIADHDMRIQNILAREDNGTFRWNLKLDTRAFLYWEALIPSEGPMTQMQQEVPILYDQGLISQTSVGVLEWDYEWEDLGKKDKMPTLVIKKARLRELSIVVYGAFGNDATIRMTLGESGNDTNREVSAVKLLNDDGTEFDAKKSYDDAMSQFEADRQKEERDAAVAKARERQSAAGQLASV